MASLHKSRGYIALLGDLIDSFASNAISNSGLEARVLDVQTPYHVTVITKEELKGIPEGNLTNLQVDPTRLFLAGVGGSRSKEVYFGVVIWAEGQQFRKRLGLPPKNFHITLTSRDNHDMDKGIDSLLPGQFPDSPSPDFLDHLVFTLHLFGQYTKSQHYATHLMNLLPDSHRGYLR